MKLFKNHNGQIRSGWKVLIALGLAIFLGIIFLILAPILLFLLGSSLPNMDGLFSNYLFEATLGQVTILLATLLAFKLVTGKPVRDLGVHISKEGMAQLGFGLVFGALSICAVYFVLILTGHVQIVSTGLIFSRDLLTGLLLFILVGFSEELFFRGYLIRAFEQMKRPWLSVLLSSLIFALAHVGNPNLNFLGFFNIGFVGALLALMFIKTHSLWMPIGYHITWNYFQGNILGLPVSGMEVSGLISSEVVKFDVLSGGAFGPEGGLFATLVIVLGFVVLRKIKDKRL